MSLRSHSHLALPLSYKDWRLHHVLVVYVGSKVVQSLWSSTKKKDSIIHQTLEHLSHRILSFASSITDQLLPLLYHPIVSRFIPDTMIRWGIQLRLGDLLHNSLQATTCEEDLQRKQAIVQELSSMPIAIETQAANDQHYEVPAKFYDYCLGPRKKYSSGYWPSPTTTFEESEECMLQMYCDRAGLQNGMSLVDLGCGWGSLTLYVAEHYPDCKITSISNSHSQREYISKKAQALPNFNEQTNLTIITCNVADDKGALDKVKNNDRVITVEMFEHMKNYQYLLHKVHGFLKPSGKLFVHIFTHKDYCYHFDDGWMSQNFFTGGTMPSDDLLLYFGQDFYCEKHWRVNGTHYERTSNGWLDYLDHHWKSGELEPVLEEAYGKGKGYEWYVNWRLFFLACAELWGYDNGEEWIVSHYLFAPK